MTSATLPAESVDWQTALPFSPRYGDRYHSSSGARAQTEHVFLGGCGLPQLWQQQPEWRMLETGFGLGLSFLSVWAAWLACEQRPRRLLFISTEAHPVSADDIRRAARLDEGLSALGEYLADAWPAVLASARTAASAHSTVSSASRVSTVSTEAQPAPVKLPVLLPDTTASVELLLLVGDARTRLQAQHQQNGSLDVDSVFLDGFDPKKNPAMWDEALMRAVALHCRPGTRMGTWSVARTVRDAAQAAGFALTRRPGLPPKRECLAGVFQGASGHE